MTNQGADASIDSIRQCVRHTYGSGGVFKE